MMIVMIISMVPVIINLTIKVCVKKFFFHVR